MDQKKIGLFLKELRKEKTLTQSQLAEQLNVSDRTVSRWETGTNLPDLSILVELADFYDIDICEIIDGERKSENMNVEMKDTLMKAAQYATEDKHIQMKKLTGYILSAFGCFLILSGFTVFPSESGWAAKFAILGAIIVTIGIFQLLKKSKLVKSIIIFIAILFGMIWLDFASVCYIRQAPRFAYSVEYSDELSSIMLRFIPYTNTAGTPWANTIKFILDLIIYKIDFHNLPVQYIYLKEL